VTATAMFVAGERITVRGTYEDIRAQMADRRMSEDDGFREFVTTGGERITVNRAAVTWYREDETATTRNAIGFR
jgi:hypothetical protein